VQHIQLYDKMEAILLLKVLQIDIHVQGEKHDILFKEVEIWPKVFEKWTFTEMEELNIMESFVILEQKELE